MRYQDYQLPDKTKERDRIEKAIAKHGPPRGCLVEFAMSHGGLDVSVLRWVRRAA